MLHLESEAGEAERDVEVLERVCGAAQGRHLIHDLPRQRGALHLRLACISIWRRTSSS